MDGPFADEAEYGRPGRLAAVAFRIVEIGERAVDRIDSRRARRDHDLVTRVMPHVARVAGGALGRKAHALRSAEVAGSEDYRFQTLGAARDLFDIDERLNLFDQDFEPDPPLAPKPHLDSREQRVDEPQIAR